MRKVFGVLAVLATFAVRRDHGDSVASAVAYKVAHLEDDCAQLVRPGTSCTTRQTRHRGHARRDVHRSASSSTTFRMTTVPVDQPALLRASRAGRSAARFGQRAGRQARTCQHMPSNLPPPPDAPPPPGHRLRGATAACRNGRTLGNGQGAAGAAPCTSAGLAREARYDRRRAASRRFSVDDVAACLW